MKVLVTGSAGFIGKHLCAELGQRGHDVVPFDWPKDVRSVADVERALYTRDIGAVVNLAGMLGTPELLGSERDAAQVNILGALNIYDAAKRYGGVPVVQIGTGHKGQPNPYAITKACAEDLGLSRAQWLGEKIAVVRAYHVYGPGQIPGAPHGPATVRKFFPTFACQALTGGNLELCGGGGQLIDPVHVSDVAAALADAIDGPYGTVTEAGCGKPVSVAQVAADITTAAGWALACALRTVRPRPGEPDFAEVVATSPVCRNPWPYLVPETIGWYREWLNRSSAS